VRPAARAGVLVVGVDSLMTQLAKCCKPAPPDLISGFVTRGKGVSVHRSDCSNLRNMVQRSGDRLIEVEWGGPRGARMTGTCLSGGRVRLQAFDSGQGLLRDISEVFAKEKMNVIGVQTQFVEGIACDDVHRGSGRDAGRLTRVLKVVNELSGVRSARRR